MQQTPNSKCCCVIVIVLVAACSSVVLWDAGDIYVVSAPGSGSAAHQALQEAGGLFPTEGWVGCAALALGLQRGWMVGEGGRM